MRKLIAFTATIIAAVCLFACSSVVKDNSSKPNGLAESFQAAVSVTIGELNAEGTIKRFGSGMWEVEFDSPNTLSGVTLSFSDGNASASYKGLNFSVPQSALPVKSMMLNLIGAADELAKNPNLSGSDENGMLKITGTLDGGEYTLTADENGNIASFEMPNNNLEMIFTDVTPIESAQEETQAASDESVTEMAEVTEEVTESEN